MSGRNQEDGASSTGGSRRYGKLHQTASLIVCQVAHKSRFFARKELYAAEGQHVVSLGEGLDCETTHVGRS